MPAEQNILKDSGYTQEIERIIKAIGETPKSVYAPSEDSYLMLNTISRVPLQGKKVLDIGTGSGILALFCAVRGAQVTATDLDTSALESTQRSAKVLGLNLKTIKSDVFSEITERFDLVLFNPPYLPSSKFEDGAVDGGIKGAMLSKRFLEELINHLKPEGEALLVVSSLNEPASLIEPYQRFEFTVLARQSLFFEELQVLRIRSRQNFAR